MTEIISFCDVIQDVKVELNAAIKKHPAWPIDVIYAVNVVSEECGEAIKAANDLVHHGGSIDNLRVELRHTCAMCIRMLMNLDNDKFKA